MPHVVAVDGPAQPHPFRQQAPAPASRGEGGAAHPDQNFLLIV